MSIGITTDHAALADTVRRWCNAVVGPAGRREGLEAEGEGAAENRSRHWDERQWDEMVAMGWPVLHAPESLGGQGFGLADLAVVLEETGRAGVPGPLLPTALAVAVLVEAGGDAAEEWVPRIAAGETGAVAFAATDDGRVFRNVLGAAGASVVIVPDGDHWRVVPRGAFECGPSRGVDLVRGVADVTVDAGAGHRVSLPVGRLADLATLLLSSEAVGIGAWCVDTAAEHARNRVQFGRPIGQFQGVKHRCADMLASLELSRAATWDACRGGDADEQRLAIACVGTVVPDAVVGIAKDCVQVLGGIGFTWEHDAHLYLRRAVATRALLPSASARAVQTRRLVADGVVRALPMELPAEAEALRPGVREWLAALKAAPRETWNQRIADDGYLVPHWPEPWGRGASAVEQVVIDQEFRAAGVRRPHLQVAAWALPTLIAHGTAAQQQRWVGPSLRQEIMWCQLFSEPEAGSDLASLRMKAVRDGDGWRLTGQKVWTSMAHTAQWGICLARTDPDRPNHDGITCFFVDMESPGIDVRPLREINGDAWFNEVFFDEVFVPDDCVIGDVNDGWRAGRTTLANERVSMGSGASIGAGVAALAGLLDEDSSPHAESAVGRLLAREAALAALRNRMTIRSLAGADAGPEASIVKLLGVIHDQDVQEAGVELFGPDAAAAVGDAAGWVSSFLWNRSLTIAGGTSEVQRNVIGERLLGLPRDA
jgi:alkylation response protein AidB-like acyl-CoA dehydrogenase